MWHFAQALEHALKCKWQTKAGVANFVSFVDAADKVDAWPRGVSPEAKWPGALSAGLDVPCARRALAPKTAMAPRRAWRPMNEYRIAIQLESRMKPVMSSVHAST